MDTLMLAGERQVARRLSGIRADHVARYKWATTKIPPGSRVVDFACGVGYGTHILAVAGFNVTGYDNSPEALDYARSFYEYHDLAEYCHADGEVPLRPFDVAVCFETIEHLENPAALLKSFCGCRLLLASVPNQSVIPYRNEKFPFHYRHYTKQEFEQLLNGCGWAISEWWGQRNRDYRSEVRRNIAGRTIIAAAKRMNA